MFHPTRAGSRGGRDQFNWDEVKNDKDRYNYLGNSVKAQVKKPWDQGAEPNWYVKNTTTGKKKVGLEEEKKKEEEEELMTELEMVKAREREYMMNVISKGFGFSKAAAAAVVDPEVKKALPAAEEHDRGYRRESKETRDDRISRDSGDSRAREDTRQDTRHDRVSYNEKRNDPRDTRAERRVDRVDRRDERSPRDHRPRDYHTRDYHTRDYHTRNEQRRRDRSRSPVRRSHR